MVDALLLQSSKYQDPYVAASPLSVAAVCRDGVALVSLHYNVDDVPEEEGNHVGNNATEEAAAADNATSVEAGNSSQGESAEDNDEEGTDKRAIISLSNKFRDLPLSTRGPLRIEPIHEGGAQSSFSQQPPPMSLLTAGWRTDGMALCDAARELMAEEVRLFCLPYLAIGEDDEPPLRSINASNNRLVQEGKEGRLLEDRASTTANNIVVEKGGVLDGSIPQTQQPYYGRRIAEGLSYYLARCSFSEGARSLSTVGLLACGSNVLPQTIPLIGSVQGEDVAESGSPGNVHPRGAGGSLHLVDATGTHRVRAHAIGNGAAALHRRMAFVDFETMNCQEGLQTLLRLIAEEGGLVPTPSSRDIKSGDDADGEGATLGKDGTTGAGGSLVAKLTPAFLQRTRVTDGELSSSSSEPPARRWSVPTNTAVELAVLNGGEGRMRRVRLSSLFP